MDRDITKKLLAWKDSKRRKPLIINGARQVGKTYSLKDFGKSAYTETVYINFEKDPRLSAYFQNELETQKLLSLLRIHTESVIKPHETLLIFDEIQQCPQALNSLKYFCEDAPEYHVAAAGSLLGVITAQQGGFPVGKVNFLDMYPLSFFEFLTALGHDLTRRFIETQGHEEPIPEPIHQKLLELLRLYFFVGGMPEAVFCYVKTQNIRDVREIQDEILEAYERDFAKHAPLEQVMKILNVWKQTPQQLAKENKKFIFALLKKSARAREYEEAIGWLLGAGLLVKCLRVDVPKFPLSAYADPSAFKLYLIDVGLLGAQGNVAPQTLLDGNQMFVEFKGALTENFVAQELLAYAGKPLYYWASEGVAEVDFLIERENEIYPLEVKAGSSRKKKSLIVYGEKYRPKKLLRSTTMNRSQDGQIENYPLYLSFWHTKST